ncbi:MAG: hypothetical protein HGB10_11055 [Coriobacteriia bacterium]|nr:hypothetical protein [Coriobacteriia bacterium]
MTAIGFVIALLLPSLFIERTGIYLEYMRPGTDAVAHVQVRLLYLLPIITAVLSLLMSPSTFSRAFRVPWAFVGVVCIVADLAVYTYAGVLEGSVAAMLSFALPVAASLGALLTGMALFRLMPAAIDWLIVTATTLSASVGAFQMAEATGLHSFVGRWIVALDTAASARAHAPIAWMRAEGFSLNPNVYTPFAIVGVIWALFGGRKGPLRWVTLASSVVIGVLGQSRTTALVIVVLLGVVGLRTLFSSTTKHNTIRRVALVVLAMLVMVGVLAGRSVYGPPDRTLTGLSSVVPRALTETGELAFKPLTDDGVASRIEAWSMALDTISKHPRGVFGRAAASMKPYPHAHNEFLQRLLYAGPLWLVVHIAFLLWLAIWLWPKGMPWIGLATASALFVNGLTEPLAWMYPFDVLLYVIIGSAMWGMTRDRSRVPVAEGDPSVSARKRQREGRSRTRR